MGICLSSNNSKVSSETINNIRVVHYNGYLESFEDPITVGQVTANVPKHFLCTPAQLVLHDLKPLTPDTQLASGHIYFLLPYSALRFEVSPVDLASLSKKLSAVAKTGRSLSTSSSPSSSPEGSTHSQKSPSASPRGSSPPMRSSDQSSAASPNRWYSDHYKITEKENVVDLRMSKKSPSWKPMLATIRERSVNRRSESELQEKHVPKLIRFELDVDYTLV